MAIPQPSVALESNPVLLCILAFLFLPIRLLQEANPEWRLVSWALSLNVVCLTLLIARIALTRLTSRTVFAILFFLVAVPWPSFIEMPLIQSLTRANTATTVELLGWTGTPALQRGNIIEISTGVIGIDQACSGIRSFQAALMISLFLGELYRLRPWGRAALVFCGFILSFAFNVLRTLLLVVVAAHSSPSHMMQTWHDPAGIGILLACFFALWGLALWLRKRSSEPERPPNRPRNRIILSSHLHSIAWHSRAPVLLLGPALATWLALSEVGVETWYRILESRAEQSQLWTVQWPDGATGYQDLPMTAFARRLLRYDDALNASWTDDGLRWQVVLLHWKPGRAASRLATGHTPDVCLTAAGRKPSATSEAKRFEVNGLSMPFRRYDIEQEEVPLHVFYCLWNENDSQRFSKSTSMTYANRFLPVIHGERNTGQRSIEIAVWGPLDTSEADQALKRELPKIIKVNRATGQ